MLFNRAVRRARAPRSPWTNRKAEADQRQMEKRQATSTNGKAKVDEEQIGQEANEHRPPKPEADTKTAPRNRKLGPRRP